MGLQGTLRRGPLCHLFRERLQAVRQASTQAGAGPVFNRGVKRLQKHRAALRADNEEYDYLRDHVAENLAGRLQDISRSLPNALDVGSWSGNLYRAISALPGRGGISSLVQCELSGPMLYKDAHRTTQGDLPTSRLIADEEYLPFTANSFDVVLSSMSLHWANDLAGCLAQIRSCLKPDGVFLGALLGGDTLKELRTAFFLAEQERDGGFSMHTSPMTTVAEVGNLLQAAGFALPTVDTDQIQVHYQDAFHLMEHLQGMGENNANLRRRPFTSRDTMMATAAVYQSLLAYVPYVDQLRLTHLHSQQLYGDDQGHVPATFQVVYIIGWKPHASQPKPLKRGSAQRSLQEGISVKIDDSAME